MGLLGIDFAKSNERGELVFKAVGNDAETLTEIAESDELKATFVRFVDHITGEPIPARTVVIKVNVTTGDIDDIVSEEV